MRLACVHNALRRIFLPAVMRKALPRGFQCKYQDRR